MTPVLLRSIEENGMLKEEFTEDGKTVSHTVITSIIQEQPGPITETPTLEEMQTQTLLNTEYLVVMSEIENV
ncbi:hypothetical protein FOA22_12445 [Heyndrickxia oleronia]|uniref:hypothetical protein n=1 Tax=Heyndrickxia oleronia TaxID=38875 RepID=UPI003339F2F2